MPQKGAQARGERVPNRGVDLRLRPVPAELVGGDYENDRDYRVRFQQWLNGLWDEDAELLGPWHGPRDPGDPQPPCGSGRVAWAE